MSIEGNVFVETFNEMKEPIGGWTSTLVTKCLISSSVGCLAGILSAFMINFALVEIVMSQVFAMVFGFGFFTCAALIALRIRQSELPIDKGSFGGRRQIMSVYVALTFLSGFMSFVIRAPIIAGVSWIFKIPMFGLLGVGLAFTTSFLVVDLINTITGFMQPLYAVPIVEDSKQVVLIIISSSVMGGCFGCIFGVMDVEDVMSYQIEVALMRETHICYPVGMVIGSLVGFTTEYLRNQDIAMNIRGRHTLYDEEL